MKSMLSALIVFVGYNMLVLWALSTGVGWLQLVGLVLVLVEALVGLFLIVTALESRKQ